MTAIQITLNLEKDTAEKIKEYVAKQQLNLNVLLENHLRDIVSQNNIPDIEEKKFDLKNREISPEILALTGIIKGDYTDEDVDNMKYEYLKEKHGL
ncbi:DUF6364 domain-containing protein [Mucilaginibacter galii]|uniref:Uncharacterized protein n=1 Tax=Mucilaginibacter galii TaxID=2005073 RepID=A0A917J784_9SPHI|nr:DUF6364 family protein [Mucilaginibacter galii]GGI49786.1 hypothetical protein GCM10011425_09980 [Mucilaginibacter galii]